MANENRDLIHMTLKDGLVVIETRPDLAPKHVVQIKQLIGEGKYDGVVFHRVIEGFMAQTGDVEFGNSNNKDFKNSSFVNFLSLIISLPKKLNFIFKSK